MNSTQKAIAAVIEEMQGTKVGLLPTSPNDLLRERVIEAKEHIQFYRILYEPYGPVPEADKFMPWFEKLPIITKSQLQGVSATALLNPKYNQSELTKKSTSGSTGVPFVLYLDKVIASFRKWRFLRPYQMLVDRPATELVFFFPWHFLDITLKQESSRIDQYKNLQSDSQNPNPELLQNEVGVSFRSIPKKTRKNRKEPQEQKETKDSSLGGTTILNRPYTVNSWLPMEEVYQTLKEINAAGLIGFASNIAALSFWMLEHKKSLPKLKQVWTTSEVLSPNAKDTIRKVLKCEPFSCYASNEFGFMAWQMDKDGPLCFESDRLFVETLDQKEKKSVEVGEFARLVITDLLNNTMPLIRYDIGDIARAGEPFHISDDLACKTINDLQGKEADLIRLEDGSIVPTFKILGLIKDHLPFAQYRFLCIEEKNYVLQYHPGNGFLESNLDKTIIQLKNILSQDSTITAIEVGKIEREKSGKLRPLINLMNVSAGKRRELAKHLGVIDYLTITNQEVAFEVVRECLSNVLHSVNKTDIHEDQELYADLGLDSLNFILLIRELETYFNQEIDDEDLLDIDLIIVKDLIIFIESMIKTKGSSIEKSGS